MSEILPIFKKKVLNKENYRPVSLLSYMSKVFEKLLHKQIEISWAGNYDLNDVVSVKTAIPSMS